MTINPPPPVITSALTASGITGTAFSYQITATNSPTSFNAAGLPAGLSVNTSNGLISGTPSAAGAASVTLSAANAGGTGTATLVLTINPPKPAITSALTASGTTTAAFSYQITATNSPTSFNAAGLPAGLSVNTSNGLVSGTPSAAGTTSVTLSAVNAGGTGTATLVITINPPKPVITSALSAAGMVGTAFNYQIAATNTPTSFGAATLPAGLSANTSNGLISGTPTSSGTASVTLSAINAGGTGTATLVVTINPAVPVITSVLTATGTVGSAFSYQIAATNSPTSFGAAVLPSGLSVNAATGLITGTPTSSGTASVSISAANAGGASTSTLTVKITPPAPVITSALAATRHDRRAVQLPDHRHEFADQLRRRGSPGGPQREHEQRPHLGDAGFVGNRQRVALSAVNAGGTSTATLVMLISESPPCPSSPARSPLPAWWAEPFNYQISATNFPASFAAADLPSGAQRQLLLSNAASSREYPHAAGTASVAMSATNAGGTGTATSHFSIGGATADLGQVRVYPIPYRPGSGNPDLGGGDTGIFFDQLPATASTINIYTVSGQKVTSFDASSASGKINWDARNGDGRDVASGLYLAVISSPSSKPVTKKILIIR